MRALIIFLRVLGYLLLGVAQLAIVVGAIGIWITDGFWAAMWLFSPFNFRNVFAMLLALAPGGGLLILAERLENRHQPAD